jgi:Zn-dependent protease with chaperone function
MRGSSVVPTQRGGTAVLVRAMLAITLLAGFYLLALGIIAGVVTVDVLLAEDSSAPLSIGALKLYGISAMVIYPVARALVLARRRSHGAEPEGLPLLPAAQPNLWAAVRRMAERSGTRAPDEIWLTADANAAVCEDSRLLGLLPGRRTLTIGAPLLIGLTERELETVLAHEFGHYSRHDTRLGALVYSGRETVLRTASALNQRAQLKRSDQQAQLDALAAARRTKGKKARKRRASGGADQLLGRLFAGYARLYVRVSQQVNRRQEYAADLAAARLAGRDATASALRKLVPLDLALSIHLRQYATMGWNAGLLPPPGQVYGGLAHVLSDPGRRRQLSELALPDEADAYDSHPPLAARVAAIERLPRDGFDPDHSGSAIAVLAHPEQTLAALERATLLPEAARMSRLDWPELAHQAGCAGHADRARPLQEAVGAPTATAALAALLASGAEARLWHIADLLPRSPEAEAATGRAAHEFVRTALRRALSDLVVLALAETGAARWDLSWSQPVRLRLPDGFAEALPPALDALVADRPDPTPLRTLLASTQPVAPRS